MNDLAFPARAFVYYGASFGGHQEPETITKVFRQVQASDSEKRRMGGVKMYLDGCSRSVRS